MKKLFALLIALALPATAHAQLFSSGNPGYVITAGAGAGDVGQTSITGLASDSSTVLQAGVDNYSVDSQNSMVRGLDVNARLFAWSPVGAQRIYTIPATDGTGKGVLAVEQAGASFVNIAGAATSVVKSGVTTLHKIIINSWVASETITIYNNTAATGTKVGTITMPATITSSGPITLEYDVYLSLGLTIVTSAAADITVIYR